MIAWLLALALGGTVQELKELEWRRAEVREIAGLAHGADAERRVAVAHALGRLHREETVSVLSTMRSDPNSSVRIAVADALGWTPGSAEVLREWLDDMAAPSGLAQRRAALDGERYRAIEALGRQGDGSDIPRLERLLAEPWPTSAAASEALGRLGRRRVEGAANAVPALFDAIERPDPRTRRAAAYAIGRLGLDEGSAGRAANALPKLDELGRAWLLKAVFPALEGDARVDLFIDAMTDPAPVVRVAALDAVAEGDLPELVAPWLTDADPWVRQATVSALGRLGEVDALQGVADQSDDPWEVAAAIGAAGLNLGRDWSDESLPVVIRAAALGVTDLPPAALVELARDAELDPPLRTAAASALLDVEPFDVTVAEALLGSSDPVVREVAVELLGRAEPAERVETLLPHIRVETDLELLGSMFVSISEAVSQNARLVESGDDRVSVAVRRAGRSDTARVLRAAEVLADQVGVAFERAAPATRQLLLPSGVEVDVGEGFPAVEDIARIRSARVETNRGSFVVALDTDLAPLAVANFASLAEAGFFDGHPFHRVVPGFVVQTGCPRGDGWGGPGWTLPDEVSMEPYGTGSVGMARSAPWDTGGSQWFVTVAPTPFLEGDYTRFGEVVQGLHVVRSLRRGDRVVSVQVERTAAK